MTFKKLELGVDQRKALLNELRTLDASAREIREQLNLLPLGEEIWRGGDIRVEADGYGGAFLIEYRNANGGPGNWTVLHYKEYADADEAINDGAGLEDGELEWSDFSTLYRTGDSQ